ncbi:MAG: hypothetical protein QXQ36_03340 [Sulfolobales archaeon]
MRDSEKTVEKLKTVHRLSCFLYPASQPSTEKRSVSLQECRDDLLLKVLLSSIPLLGMRRRQLPMI